MADTPVTTTQMTVTSAWMKVSDGDCVMQSELPHVMYEIALSATTPASNARLVMLLTEPTTFDRKTPVWIRLHAKGNAAESQIINVIK